MLRDTNTQVNEHISKWKLPAPMTIIITTVVIITTYPNLYNNYHY